jgi:hypothetical protein
MAWGYVAVAAAGISGAAVGSYLLVMELTGISSDNLSRSALWISIVLTTVGAAMILGAAINDSGAQRRRVGATLKSIASAIGIVGLLTGGAQWWYTNQYAPATINPAISIKTDITEYGPPTEDHMRALKVDLTVKNTSKVALTVVASMYSVTWIHLTPSYGQDGIDGSPICLFEQMAPVEESECNQPNGQIVNYAEVRDPTTEYHDVSRSATIQSVDPLELGEPVQANWHFEPDEEYAKSFTIHVPKNVPLQDELELRTDLVAARGERLQFASAPAFGPEIISTSTAGKSEMADQDSFLLPRFYPKTYEVASWNIKSLGVIPSLTMPSESLNIVRVLSLRRGVDSITAPYLIVCPEETERAAGTTAWYDFDTVCPGGMYPSPESMEAESAEKVQNFYGIAETNSIVRIPLMPKQK